MIFIDVELSEITGIELGYQIRKYTGDKDISIVFISGKTIYCQQLFQLEPQNFHHKPLCEQDIVDDIEKLIKRIRKQKNLLKYYDEGVPKGILLRDILYVESRGNTIEITKKGNDKVILRESISQIEERFSEFYMCRCHRSFIANLYYVDKYCNQKFCMKNGDEIPVGRTYVNKVRQQWINYEKETL